MSRSWDELSWEERFDELVAEGLQLAAREDLSEGEFRFKWGDIALEVAPVGDDHARNGGYSELRRYAKAVDRAFETLRDYRKVVAAWPDGARAPSVAWSVHRELLTQPDRFQLIKRPEGWTWRQATQLVADRKAAAKVAAQEPVGKQGADPSNGSSNGSSKGASRSTSNGTSNGSSKSTSNGTSNGTSKSAAPKQEPVSDRHDDFDEAAIRKQFRDDNPVIAALDDGARARHDLIKATRLVRELLLQLVQQPLNEKYRDAVLRDADQLQVTVDWLIGMVRNGDMSFVNSTANSTSDFDQELEALLKGEAN
jgi:hypothetical protein